MATAPPQINGVNGIKKPLNPPNQTLYIGNLPTSKINKQDLRRALYCLFSTYGPVLDVVHVRGKEKRGTAHVVYRDSQISSQAMRALQGTEFFGREIKIEYARGKSDVISRLDGSAKTPESKAQQATTAAQQSIFTNPNAQLPDKPSEPVPASKTAAAPGMAEAETATQGTKRAREEEDDDDDEDQPMDEDSEGDAMEESDDE